MERLRQLLQYDPDSGQFIRLTSHHSNRAWRAGTSAGYLHPNGYVLISIDNTNYVAHRLARFYVTGEWPAGQVDHVDGNRANNRWANLRDVPASVNSQNRRRAARHNKTGFLGVCKHKDGRFQAGIEVNGQSKHLGLFDTAEEAHTAYVAAKRQLHEGNTL